MWRFVLKLALSAALLWLLLRGRDLASLSGAIGKVDRGYLALAAGGYWCVALPSALRWSKVVEALGYRLTFGRSLLFVLIGYFFNQTLLSAIGGDGVRVWKAYRAGLSAAAAVNGVLIDRAMQYVAHMLLVIASLPALFRMISDWRVHLAVLVLLIGSALGLTGAATVDRFPLWLRGLRPIAFLLPLSAGLRRVLFVPHRATLSVLLGLANQVGVLVVVTILALGLHLSISWLQCLVVVPVAMLMTALPISIGGWGVREGSFVVGFGLIGVPAGDALTLSVLFGLLNMVVRLPGGFIWLAAADKPRALNQVSP